MTTKATSHTEQHYTLGIAGHIDHGKTTLTKALTGKETDRLKEEQERNISIEVGFASFPISNDKQVGVVDVPGHERFIRQMVAGVAGIDLVLLVVAADEGVMPQTKEHLDILNLLGLKKGLIVLTKADTVEEEMLELVRDQVQEETEQTFLEGSPILEVDSLSGRGIDALKEEIEKILVDIPSKTIEGIARLPIDRVFSKKGFGTIVTGTLYQGKLKVGDELEVLPSEKKVKIRSLQVHGKNQEAAYAGQRVAANLTGIDTSELHRGDVLATPNAIQSSHRLDIEWHMLADLQFNIKQRSDVRLHIGTSEVLGRIIFFDRNECRPGETCFAQLELVEPVTALFADRFVLRRPTPMTTIGGGMVIDPYAEKHRFGQQTIRQLEAKKEGDLPARAAHIVEEQGVQTLAELTRQLGISREDWEREMAGKKEHGLKIIEDQTTQITLVTTERSWQTTWQHIRRELEDFHQQYPLREGLDRKKVQAEYFPSLHSTQWNALLKLAEREGLIKVKNESVSAPRFEAVLRQGDRKIWDEVKRKMDSFGIEVPPWEALIPSSVDDMLSRDLQHWLVRHDEIVPLGEGRFISKDVYEHAVQRLKENTSDTFTIQDVRKVFDASRKYLIPFLESLDDRGHTVRQDQVRRWINKHRSIKAGGQHEQ